MNSEKAKEIKKALETCMHTRVSSCRECPYNYTNTKTKHSECFRMAEHALTLINGLENENEWLRLERDVLIGKKIVEKQKYDNALMVKIDIQKQLKNRIAELEDKIENGTLKELPCKVGSRVYAVNHSKYNISGGYVSEEFVNKIHISSHTILVETTENGIWISKSYLPQDFGDIVFTTKAEAEAKLKELQEEQE